MVVVVVVLLFGGRNLGHGISGGSRRFAFFRFVVQVDHFHSGNVCSLLSLLRRDGIAIRTGRAGALALAGPALIAFRLAVILGVFLIALRRGIGAFFGQQSLAVGDGDLVIIGVNFRKRQKTMAVSAVVDKGGLQRGFNPRYLGQIDIAR